MLHDPAEHSSLLQHFGPVHEEGGPGHGEVVGDEGGKKKRGEN